MFIISTSAKNRARVRAAAAAAAVQCRMCATAKKNKQKTFVFELTPKKLDRESDNLVVSLFVEKNNYEFGNKVTQAIFFDTCLVFDKNLQLRNINDILRGHNILTGRAV